MAKAPVKEEQDKEFKYEVPSHGLSEVKANPPGKKEPMQGAGFTTTVKQDKGIPHEIIVNYNND